ncbi:uncharacterized protein LOC142352847 isoform X2 [Convolutriloba macropyga]
MEREKEKKQHYDPNQLRNMLTSGRKSVKSVSCLGKSWFDLLDNDNSSCTSEQIPRSRASSAKLPVHKTSKTVKPEHEMRDLSDSEISYVEELDFDTSILFNKENDCSKLYPTIRSEITRKHATFSANLTKRYVRASTAKSNFGGINTAANTTALSNYIDDDIDETDKSENESFTDEEAFIAEQSTTVLEPSFSQTPFRESASVFRKPKSGLIFRPFTPSLNINQNFNRQSAHVFGRKGHETGPFSLEERNEVLYRQLCVLLWIFNNLIVEPSYKFTSLATCFSRLDPGGQKVLRSKVLKEKADENEWEKLFSEPKPKRRSRSKSMYVPKGESSSRTENNDSSRKHLKREGSATGSLARLHSAGSHTSSNVSFADRSSAAGLQLKSQNSVVVNETNNESVLDTIGITEAIVEEIGEENFESLASRPTSGSSSRTADKSQADSRPVSSSNKVRDNTLVVNQSNILASSAESEARKPLEQLDEDEEKETTISMSESFIQGNQNQPIPGTADTAITTTEAVSELHDETALEISHTEPKNEDESNPTNNNKSASDYTGTAPGTADNGSMKSLDVGGKTEKSSKKVEFTQDDEEEFSSTILADNAADVPIRMRNYWSQVKLEHGLQMRDFLAQHKRVQRSVSRAKLNAIGEALNARKSSNIEFNDAISLVRQAAKPIYQQDRDAQEQYVDWYITLVGNLPSSFGSKRSSNLDGDSTVESVGNVPAHHDKVLTRFEELGRVGSVPSQMITGAALKRFLLEDAKLRAWELCDPNVRPAIDFFCEHVANLPKSEFLDWLAGYSPHFAAVESVTMAQMKADVEEKQKAAKLRRN